MNRLYPILICALLIFGSHSRPAFSQVDNFPYPDPILPDSLPLIFSRETISLPDTYEEGITFSPNADELFITRSVKKDGNIISSKIFTSKRSGNMWSSIVPASFSSNTNESEPAFSADGKTLFFLSERNKPGITSYIGEVWMVKKTSGRWGQAEYPQNILNETWINNVSSTGTGKIYFSSYRNKKIGIYSAGYNNGQYEEPVFLPEEINGIAGASNPFVSSDESIIVFEGKSTGYNKSELYISFRTSAGLWTPAHKLNENVNQTGTESNPSLSPDGKYLFFTREGDIYWIRLEYVF